MKPSHLPSLLAILLPAVISTTSSHAAVAFSQPVVDREPIYNAGEGEQADNFSLNSTSAVAALRFWGGYGSSLQPSHRFTVRFYVDTGLNEPQKTALFTASLVPAARTQTTLSTWPGNPVFQYELTLPQPVALQASTRYYLSITPENTLWSWSGAGWGSFWWRYPGGSSWSSSYPGNPHNLAFELLSQTTNPAPPPLLLAGTAKLGAFHILQLSWTNSGVPCILETAESLTGSWTTVSAPATTNANCVSTTVSSPNPSQFYRLRNN